MKKSFLRSTLLAAMIASVTGGASAAGLGRINVFSALGQPLRAEVEIAATPDELEAMSARLASAEAHAKANIEFAGELNSVRISIERRASGGAVVKISSDRAFNEPFVDMLVELNWGGGRILREYTFLLDPAETAAVKPVPQVAQPSVKSDSAPVTSTPAPAVTTSPAPKSSAPSETLAAPSGEKTAKPAKEGRKGKSTEAAPAATVKTEGDYSVQSGDTASSIATKLKPVEVTRDQMMAALYQANQSAFGGGNINKLRTGQVLKVPAAEEAARLGKSEAREIIVKASSFESLKNDVATAVSQAPAKDAKGSQTASGKLAPKVEEKAPTGSASKDQLKISKTQVDKAGGATADAGKSNARIQALQEDVAARDKALAESKSRAAELEKNVKELEKLVKMKSDNLAELQKQAATAAKQGDVKLSKAELAAAKAAEAKAAKEAKAAEAKAAKEAKEKAAADKAAADKAEKERVAKEKADKARSEKEAKEKAAQDARDAAAKEKADKEAAKEQAAKDLAAKQQAEKDAAAAAEAQSAAAAAAALAAANAPADVSSPAADMSAPAEVSAPAPTPAPVVASAPAPSEGKIVEEEQHGPLDGLIPWGAALVALIGGGLVWRNMRKRNAANSGMTTSLSEASTSPNSVFGNAGGQTVDTGTSVLHTDFSQSGLSAIDTDEGVDPVAEADVYMAYGRDAQAEEILLDALKNDPSRVAIYLKLLEIYAQRRSLKQFETIATDLYTQTGGAGDDWAKAAALGARLDPGNPLYGSGNAPVVEAAPSADVTAVVAAPSLPPEAPAAEPAAVSFGTNNASAMRATWTVPGEISQFTGSGDEVPMAPEPVVQAMVSTSPEPLNLDFNLDLELPEGDAPETRVEARENDDLPLTVDSLSVPPAAGAPLEFDLDVGDLGHEPTPSAAARHIAAEAAVDQAMQALSETDADMGIERAMDRTSLSVVDLEKTNFESSLLDFDFELGEDTNVSRSNMDMSDISLVTDAGLGKGAPAHVPAAPSASRSQVEFVDTSAASQAAVGQIDLNDEVSTKLELARAYEEMGDVEGARELLEEVMTDGADAQKEMAKTILTRIA